VISLETAKKLKEAGLEWETETGDLWIQPDYPEYLRAVDYDPTGHGDPLEKNIWIPRLDQLLTEIEKRGWQIELVKYARWRITIWKIQCRKQGLFVRETPGEAAAEALLYVLEQEYEADE
jgi:hypothetical protein